MLSCFSFGGVSNFYYLSEMSALSRGDIDGSPEEVRNGFSGDGKTASRYGGVRMFWLEVYAWEIAASLR